MFNAIRKILEDNKLRREGRAPVQNLEDGEVVFKIPTKHYNKLVKRFPDLVSHDHTARLAAWHKLRQSAWAEQYLVTRTPRQVKNSQRGIIVR